MPNIEFIGFSEEEYKNLKSKIIKLMKGLSALDDMVFTHYHSTVTDKDEKSAKFIRVSSTPRSDIEEIVKRIKTIGIDVEEIELKAFHPA